MEEIHLHLILMGRINHSANSEIYLRYVYILQICVQNSNLFDMGNKQVTTQREEFHLYLIPMGSINDSTTSEIYCEYMYRCETCLRFMPISLYVPATELD
jgi:hypothetical protein